MLFLGRPRPPIFIYMNVAKDGVTGRFAHENKGYFVVMIIMCNFDMIKIEVCENEKI